MIVDWMIEELLTFGTLVTAGHGTSPLIHQR